MKNLIKTYAPIVLTMSLFGLSFVWTEQLLTFRHFPPQSLVLFRLFFSALLLGVFLVATKRFQRPKRRDLKWFFLLALFEPFIYFIGETNGLRITQSPSLGAIIIATIPLFTMIACFIFYKERSTWVNIAGMLMTLPGVALVMFNDDLTLQAPLSGALLFFMAAVATAGYAVVIRKLSDYSPFTIVTFQGFIGALYFLWPALGFERPALADVRWGFDTLYPLAMLTVFVSALAFVLFVYSVKKIGVARSNMFTAFVPVVAAITVVITGREVMAWHQVAGMVTVVSGVVLSQWQPQASGRTTRQPQ
ncbi:MAG: DMT family transporter [Prevotellaceae bacterium]|jgi:drug/metabolite transporter (DMT)-like permease|nr:DMT family transporter [Prevotellaceae bacterium]